MQNKIILITGGAKRVGAAICRRLHARGAKLLVHYRSSDEAAQTLQNELNQQRADSVGLAQADLLDQQQLIKLVEATVQHFGRLDVLINNASSFFATPLGQCSSDDWNDLIGSNLRAPLFCRKLPRRI